MSDFQERLKEGSASRGRWQLSETDPPRLVFSGPMPKGYEVPIELRPKPPKPSSKVPKKPRAKRIKRDYNVTITLYDDITSTKKVANAIAVGLRKHFHDMKLPIRINSVKVELDGVR